MQKSFLMLLLVLEYVSIHGILNGITFSFHHKLLLFLCCDQIYFLIFFFNVFAASWCSKFYTGFSVAFCHAVTTAHTQLLSYGILYVIGTSAIQLKQSQIYFIHLAYLNWVKYIVGQFFLCGYFSSFLLNFPGTMDSPYLSIMLMDTHTHTAY